MLAHTTPRKHTGHRGTNMDVEEAGAGTIDVGQQVVHIKASSVKKIDAIVENNQGKTLSILRNWLHQEET